MDPFATGVLSVVLVIFLIIAGVPIAVSLALVCLVGMWILLGHPLVGIQMLGSAAFHGIFDYAYSVVPMFVLMGFLANMSGAAEEAYDLVADMLRGRRGGLAMATVLANAIFAAITGISVASAAMFSRISLGPMLRHGYDRTFSLGTIAGSSILGMLIPPSVLLILYGIVAQESIGALFTAGIVPGLLLALIYCLGIYVMAIFRPSLVGHHQHRPEPRQCLGVRGLLGMWPVASLILLVLGGIYGGFFTPTEAGAMGAFGALLLTLFRKRMNIHGLWRILMETGYISVSILFILVAANMYSRVLTISGLPEGLCRLISDLSLPPLMVIVVFMVVLILLGAILDSTSIVLITLPIMLPAVKELGFNLVWFGIISTMAIETGLITPPLGLVVYTMKATLGEEAGVEQIFRGVLSYLVMMIVVLGLVIAFPPICLWLTYSI